MKLIQQIPALFTVLLLIAGQATWGQAPSNWVEIKTEDCNLPRKERKKIHIQEVGIKDTLLIGQINQFIQEETQKDSMFRKGLWYLYVIISSDKQEDVAQSYYINVSMISLKKDSFYPKEKNINVDLSYPPFYAYVGGRLVFIRNYALQDAVCYRYSEKSKRKLRKLQEPFLEKTRKEKAYNMDGTLAFIDRHARLEHFKLHGGKTIIIYKDKNRPPAVIPDFNN